MTTCAVNCLSVNRLALPDHGDLTDLFSHYAHRPWSMLLDSANSQHSDGRFDILVADPVATCVFSKGITTVWHKHNNSTEQSDQNPNDMVQSLLNKYIPDNGNEELELPFKVGAMGYWGYDFGRQLEDLPSRAKMDYQAPDLAVGIYTWSVVRDSHSGEIFLCYLNDYPRPSEQQISDMLLAKISDENFELKSDWQGNMDKAQYVEKLSRIHEYLVSGDCYQVNMTQRFSAQYQGCEWQAYLNLRKANQAPFSAFIRLEQLCILSISPERFVSLKNNQVQTKPIKGTRPRGKTPEQDRLNIEALRHSAKDCAENLMIVDLLRNDLSKSCEPGSVEVPDLFAVESFAAVHHLVSTVNGRLKSGFSGLDLLQNAFPGGSITGAPKIRAMEIIDELEPHRRNIYCGSIGYLGINQDMDTSICIRTLLCENNTIHCWAGGGIVVDSEPESEYQECFDKVSKILPVLSGIE